MPVQPSLEARQAASPLTRSSRSGRDMSSVCFAHGADRGGGADGHDSDSLLHAPGPTCLPSDAAPFLFLPGRGPTKSALPRNFYHILACTLGCAVVIFLGIFTPMVVLNSDASAANSVLRAGELNAGTLWAGLLRNTLTDGLFTVRTLEGLVMSAFPNLPPFNATPDASGHYNVNSHLQRFRRVAALQASQEPVILLQAICPAGIITMVYPYDAAIIGRNLLSPSDPSYNDSPTPLQTIAAGHQTIGVPRPSTVASAKGTWVVLARVPIYNKTLEEAPSLENFWGFVLLTVNVSSALNAIEVAARANQQQFDFILYDTALTYNNSNVIASSLPSSTTQAEYDAFIAGSTVTDVLAPFSHLQIAVLSQQTYASLTPSNITLIVMWTLLGSLALFGGAVAIILWYRREYDAAAHAPKLAPFAMLTIGPHRVRELWDTARDDTLQAFSEAGRALSLITPRYGAYPIRAQSPLIVSYVTRSVSSAVQMAFGLIEELQRHPIDAPPRAVLGEDAGRLEVCCAVHWCTDAAVRVESLQGSYRYEGPDVVFGGRMWAFAAPGVVTASAAVVEQLPCRGLVGVEAHAYQTVDVMGRRHSAGSRPSASQSGPPVTGNVDGVQRTGRRASGANAQLYLLLPRNNASAAAAAAQAIAIAHTSAPPRMVEEARVASSAYRALANDEHVRNGAVRPASPPAAPAEMQTPQHVTAHAFVGACHAATTWNPAIPASSVPRHLPQRQWPPRSFAAPRPLPEQRVCHAEPRERGQETAAGGGHQQQQQQQQQSGRARLLQGLDGVTRPTSTSRVPPSAQSSTPLQRRRRVYVETDAVTRALLQPAIPRALDVTLRTAFDQHAVIVGISYDEVRPLVYYFYTSYTILFRPLAGPERHNIFRRLVSAFGVPQQGVLEHLAARGAMQWLVRVRRRYGTTSQCPVARDSWTGSGSRRTAGPPPPSASAPPPARAAAHVRYEAGEGVLIV